MPVEFTYQCVLASGLHARPCSQIAEIANRFAAEVTLTNHRNVREANGKSVLSMLSADVLDGDECSFVVRGTDEVPAAAALRAFLEKELAAIEEAQTALPYAQKLLPRALRRANIPAAFGVPLSPGFGRGTVVFAAGVRLPELGQAGVASDSERETHNLMEAIGTLRNDFANIAARASKPARGIVQVQLALLNDVAFAETLFAYIQQGSSAGDAIIRTARAFSAALSRSESTYIRERAVDIQEVSLRLYETVYGKTSEHASSRITAATVIVAENLGTQELLQLDRTQMRGIIFGDGQTTSHAVILARALGIPAIAGATEVKRLFAAGDEVIIDGQRGYVVGIGDETLRFYQREYEVESLRRKKLRQYAGVTGSTADFHSIEVAANVSSAEEAEAAFQNGCDAIGLFRTEMLFVGREAPPSEDEQLAAYARAVCAASGKSVILRTLDVGGDKPVAFLALPREADSSLKHRGIAIYKEHPELLRTQLRAMLRASAHGKVRIMAPLISNADEIFWVKKQLELAKQELEARKQPFDPDIELGIMVELPDVVPNLGTVAAHADFFSIGTNDLAQYFFAEDRTRSKSDLRASVRDPTFLRLLHDIATKAKKSQRWLGMCGEMAGDPRNLPLLVGLGLDEISIGADVLEAKRRLAKLSTSSCIEILGKAMSGANVSDVEALLATSAGGNSMPVVDSALVITGSKSVTREDAIRELVDVLYLEERTDDPDSLEDALWEREASYSTDMGLGFALPHCKGDAVQHSSIAILQPQEPFLWSGEGAVPVRAIIMLAMKNDTGTHMQVLAKLARRLIDEPFRERLLACTSGQDAVQLLTHEVGIT